MRNYDLEVPVSKSNLAIEKENDKCITCGYCKKTCSNDITVARMFEVKEDIEPICINCGQCAIICPTEAIHEKFSYLKLKNVLHNKKDKKVVFSIAPAVRVALGEDLGFEEGTNLERVIPSILRKLGADYVFDITFGADLTVMEEAMEFVNRIKNDGVFPQFTSCCPAWVKYAEIFYPQFLPNLSSAKSPIAMQSTLIKTYFAKQKSLKSEDIINVVVAPCTAKKSEIEREELNYTTKDTDYLLTTRELALLIKEEKIDINNLEESNFDSPLGKGSSAGVIFGATGGVMEAALRTAYYFITGTNLKENELVFSSIRGMDGIKTVKTIIAGKEIRGAVCNGMKNAKVLLDQMLKGECNYHFIEVMNCSGGCIAGGGQPKTTLLNMKDTKNKRLNALYDEDAKMSLRFSHENPEIKEIYSSFLKEVNSPLALELLHTKYFNKSYMLEGDTDE